jgi:hypothetical protein
MNHSFWLEMIEGCEIDNSTELKELQSETDSIIRVLVKARMNTVK